MSNGKNVSIADESGHNVDNLPGEDIVVDNVEKKASVVGNAGKSKVSLVGGRVNFL